jgi:hypothetical protein
MVETYSKRDGADIDVALDRLARIEAEMAQAETRAPRGSLALISVWAGLFAPFIAVVTLAVCDALSAVALGSGGDQAATEAAQLAVANQLRAIDRLFFAGEALGLVCTLLALGLGIAAVRRAHGRIDAPVDARMAWGGMLLGAFQLVAWLALGVWLLATIGLLS